MIGEALEDFYVALLDDDAQQLYERAPCGYLSTTPDGMIIKVNQTFLTMTGYSRADLVGRRTFAELLTAGGRIYHETHFVPMLRMQNAAREIAMEVVRADRRRVPVLVNSVLERDSTGAPIVVRTAIFDATERREYERELLRAKKRAEESEARAKSLARTLQHALIPPAPPEVLGLDLAAVYRPAGNGEEVGGDFYDVFQIGSGDWAVNIGDVCGKGVEAAAVTALARHTLRAAAVSHPEPSAVLRTLNDVLLRHETDRFCTVAFMRLRQEQCAWTATLSSGGHPLPWLASASRQPAAVGRPGTLLGVLDDGSWHDTVIPLQPGDALVLFTDGVTEGRCGPEFYGTARLAAAIAAHNGSARSLAETLTRDVLDFQSNNPRDDIAVVVVAVPPA